MIRYYLSKYLAPIYSFKELKNGYYYAFPVGGHTPKTIRIYDSAPNLIHIEGHIDTVLYKNHFHRSLFIPKFYTIKNVQILIKDGFIRLYVPLKVKPTQTDMQTGILLLDS
uniref:SHSP domain-containing protein n=1 Tax=viral metagenome TaxID=1070528 RepID=A0A6C0CSJ2_9ZZZZ